MKNEVLSRHDIWVWRCCGEYQWMTYHTTFITENPPHFLGLWRARSLKTKNTKLFSLSLSLSRVSLRPPFTVRFVPWHLHPLNLRLASVKLLPYCPRLLDSFVGSTCTLGRHCLVLQSLNPRPSSPHFSIGLVVSSDISCNPDTWFGPVVR